MAFRLSNDDLLGHALERKAGPRGGVNNGHHRDNRRAAVRIPSGHRYNPAGSRPDSRCDLSVVEESPGSTGQGAR